MVIIIEFALENTTLEGAINCTAPEMITNKEFSKILGRILKRPSLFTVPSFMLKLIIGEFAETILNGRYIIPKKLMDNGFKFDYPDAESALKEIYGE
jgi:NAD dependent epimerase/dehydratase family enzyme